MMNTARNVRSRRMAVTLSLTLFPALSGVAGATHPAGAEGRAYVVDIDRIECPDAGYQSIQAAVDAATPGSRIEVCPDRYSESVTVPKTLTIEARREGHAQDCFAPSSADPPDPSRDAIITGASTAFQLRASDIVIDGFVLQENGIGVAADATVSGYLIRNNLFQSNQSGVVPGSSGAQTSVLRHNCFQGHDRVSAGPFGPIPGSAIVSLGTARNLSIEKNSFSRNTFGIRFGGAPDVRISHNRSLHDGTWLRMGGTRDLVIRHNHVGAGPFEGMLFFPQGGQTTGAPNLNAVISHNVITGRGLDGFRTLAGSSSLVDSLLSHNRISGNGRDGVRIESGGNAGNRIEHNHLLANGEHDCHDDTQGSGTAGSANVWLKNRGATEHRAGLCERFADARHTPDARRGSAPPGLP